MVVFLFVVCFFFAGVVRTFALLLFVAEEKQISHSVCALWSVFMSRVVSGRGGAL